MPSNKTAKIVKSIKSSMLSANLSIISLKVLGAEAPSLSVMGGEERLTNTYYNK